MKRVLITGAGGFVGRELCAVLNESGFEVVAAVRAHGKDPGRAPVRSSVVMPIDRKSDWSETLKGIDVVIHLAAKVHVMAGNNRDGNDTFREVNVLGTENLAKQAAGAGVSRFIFLSSIKVNGERTDTWPFTADGPCDPQDAYATSKAEAELALRAISAQTDMEVVVIRPPLVYGSEVKGNLDSLVRAIKRGIPLPFAAINNCRDLVSLYNLCDLIKVCCTNPAAAGKTFLVSDGQALSTPALIRHLAAGIGKEARLFAVPVGILRLVAGLGGRSAALNKLIGDLQIDMSETQEVLDWRPPYTVVDSFKMMLDEG